MYSSIIQTPSRFTTLFWSAARFKYGHKFFIFKEDIV